MLLTTRYICTHSDQNTFKATKYPKWQSDTSTTHTIIISKDIKGKTVNSKSSISSTKQQYYVLVTLLINILQEICLYTMSIMKMNMGMKKKIYEPQGYFSDIKDDRIGTYLHVFRWLHIISRDENWHWSNVFYTYVTHNSKY